MKLNNKKGFTLVELVIVIAVIAILAAVLIPTFSNILESARENAAMQNARNTLTDYLSDSTDNLGKDYVIKSGDYYFLAVDGSFNSTKATVDTTEGTYTVGTNTFKLGTEAKTSGDVTIYNAVNP